MKANVILLVAVFVAAMVVFAGCESPVETVDGDREVVQDGDEPVEETDDITETDGDREVVQDGDEPVEETDDDVIDPVGCTTHEECNDGRWCTGVDWCDFQSGECQHRYPLGSRCEGDGYCNEDIEACTTCLNDNHCDGEVCVNGECVECREDTDCPEDDDTATIAVCEDGVCGYVEGCREDSDCSEDGNGWTIARCINEECEQIVECHAFTLVPDEEKVNIYASYEILPDGDSYRINNIDLWYPPYNEVIEIPEGRCIVLEFPKVVGWPSDTLFYGGEGADGWSSGPKLLKSLYPLWNFENNQGYGMVSWGPDWSPEDD